MNQHQQFLKSLTIMGSPEWVNQYYDLVKTLLGDLKIAPTDLRLVFSTPEGNQLPLILGQRYVIYPYSEEWVKCIVPIDFEIKESKDLLESGTFSTRKVQDAKMLFVRYRIGEKFPQQIYKALLECCQSILHRSNKSGYAKGHYDLIYDFILDSGIRKDIISEAADYQIKKDSKKNRKKDRYHKGILLTWNPARWDWKDRSTRLREIQTKGSTLIQWSCGNNKSLKPGDRAFLIMLGNANSGIIGSGIIKTEPFQDKHFNKKDGTALYVHVELEILLDLDKKDLPLPVKTLKEDYPEQHWTPQSSGIQIKEKISDALEQAWFDHLSSIPLSFNPFNEIEESLQDLYEGRSYQVVQTKYERNPEARRQCLKHHKPICKVCQFDFEQAFGNLGKGFIHVHHVQKIADAGGRYKIDPINDLVPVCPNCHAMLHRKSQPLTPIQLIEIMKKSNK
jgi:5-methylcytosine-specific restriction enzyme A